MLSNINSNIANVIEAYMSSLNAIVITTALTDMIKIIMLYTDICFLFSAVLAKQSKASIIPTVIGNVYISTINRSKTNGVSKKAPSPPSIPAIMNKLGT